MKRSLLIFKESFIKKQLLLIAVILGSGFTAAKAQTFEYRSYKSGDWNVPATWQKRVVGTSTWGSLGINEQPTYLSGPITILNGHTVTLTANLTVDQLTVEHGSTLVINFPVSLTVNDGAGTDMFVKGTVLAKGRGGENYGNIYKTVSSADLTFAEGSVYKHEYAANADGKTAWGIIPTANWDAASTLEINVAGATMVTSNIPASTNLDQSFGNVVWNTPLLSGNISLMAALSEIKGSFEVISTGTSQLVLNNSTNNNFNFYVGQDFRILNNSKVVFAATNPNNSPGIFSLNIGRSLEVSPTAAFSHSRTTYPVAVTFTGSNGTIYSPNVIRNMNFEIDANANITLLSTFGISNSMEVYGTLNAGTNSVYGGGSFNLNGGAFFGIGSPTGLNGNFSVTNKYFSPSSTFIFNGIYPQSTGSSFPSTVGGLVIDNAGNSVELTNGLIVTNLLSLQNGVLSTAGKTLTLIESPSLSVVQNAANTSSYIDGTVRYEAGTPGSKSILFPIGKNNVYRPITLTLTQGNGTNTYTAFQTESALVVNGSFPGEIEAVSDKRSYTINRGGGASVSNAFVSLAFNADEVVSNTEMRIIKSNANNTWSDLGGTPGANNTVVSTIPFTSFSQFAIAYKTVTPLPVELISFKAVKAENAVNVLWATASEKNNAYFAVERSADGKNFAAIGQVEGAGTTSAAKNYAFLDKNPLNNVSYYRLKQVDLDGTFEYSQIVKVLVTNRAAGLSLTAFPNPTTDNVNIQIAGLNEAATLQVFDMTGRLVSTRKIAKDAAQAEVSLANVPAGIYSVKLVTTAEATVLKVIKK